ncbi:LacI family DNA-binding transcriptional regulator [Flavobacterium sp. W21_SRS_FM6]|uniref:LacI family DNA-binding transcriptional regulator n=1 Tax=Flavobacterium sp. W21_SRS_FM6 TaxID=3240268 RepID=UPI003F93E4F0
MKKPTIKDVAKLAGVSFKTVSRVVNGESCVSEQVKNKVQLCIEQLNYQPNRTAQVMRRAPKSIAFVYDNPNSHYVIEMQNGILSECRKKGFELVIHPTDSHSEQVKKDLASMIGTNLIGGVILTPPLSENNQLITYLLNLDAKVVRILSGSQAPDSLSPTIYVDDINAGQKITNHLLTCGHKRIAFIGHQLSHMSSEGRLTGYRKALATSSIQIDENIILPGEFTFESGVEMTNKLMEKKPRPTAIFACNDEIAAGAIFAARLRNLRVPEDISIVGFEDSPFSRQTWPKLTTVHQPNADIAAKAAAFLIDLMLDAPCAKPKSYGFQLDLVERDSVFQLAD